MVRGPHDNLVGWQLQVGREVVTNTAGDWFRIRREGYGSSIVTERGKFEVDVRLGLAGERPALTGLVLLAADGHELTSTDLKQVSIPSLIDAIFRNVHEVAPLEEVSSRRRGPGAPKVTDLELREFAKIYRQAVQRSPRAPTRTAAEMTGKPESTVRRWRKRAEDAGYLSREDS